MKFKYPIIGAMAILVTVLLSQALLWPCHKSMVESRGGETPRWQFAPIADGARFPRSSHNLCPVEPVPEETPTPDASRSERLQQAREIVLRTSEAIHEGKSP